MTPEYKTVPILDAARRAGVRIADGQAGRYEFKAFCPFCLGRTKNPHLYLNTEKNRFFCQRCGEHGNSVSLYAKIRGISNKEAFEELEKSNLQMFPQAAPKEPRQEYKLTKQMQRIGLVKKKLTTITLGYTSYPICEIDEQTLTKYAA